VATPWGASWGASWPRGTRGVVYICSRSMVCADRHFVATTAHLLLPLLMTATLAMPYCAAHGDPRDWPINAELGVSGFPDCRRLHPERSGLSMEAASFDLDCMPRYGAERSVRIACVGDSITAGVHSSGGNHTYPFQLQMLLDKAHGWGAFTVHNLGACGSTMLKRGDSPYWDRPQFQALVAGEWDVVTIMLGTNDAKDHGVHSRLPDNSSDWQHDCGGFAHTTTAGCTFAEDFAAMVKVAKKHGRGGTPPKVIAMTPPPLMADRAYGMNQSVINSVLPKLLPLIKATAGLDGLIDIYAAMGGVTDWRQKFPEHGCTLNNRGSWAPCRWWCDAQSCDQCHPNDVGYAHLAQQLYAGIAPMLPPPPPPPPPTPPPPPGVWIYQASGTGRLFVPLGAFLPNNHSGRGGRLAWCVRIVHPRHPPAQMPLSARLTYLTSVLHRDACQNGVNGTRFDNNVSLWPGTSGEGIGAFQATGSASLRGAGGCDLTYSYNISGSLSAPFDQTSGLRYDSWLYLEQV
jgi:lysophospholipase L1-like esterase